VVTLACRMAVGAGLLVVVSVTNTLVGTLLLSPSLATSSSEESSLYPSGVNILSEEPLVCFFLLTRSFSCKLRYVFAGVLNAADFASSPELAPISMPESSRSICLGVRNESVFSCLPLGGDAVEYGVTFVTDGCVPECIRMTAESFSACTVL